MDKKMRILPPLLRKRKLIEVANSEEAIRELKARRGVYSGELASCLWAIVYQAVHLKDSGVYQRRF